MVLYWPHFSSSTLKSSTCPYCIMPFSWTDVTYTCAPNRSLYSSLPTIFTLRDSTATSARVSAANAPTVSAPVPPW